MTSYGGGQSVECQNGAGSRAALSHTHVSRTACVTNSTYTPNMARDLELLCHHVTHTHVTNYLCHKLDIYICILQVDIASRWGRPKSCTPKWREIARCYTTHTCVTNYIHHELNTLIRNVAGSRTGNNSQKVRPIVILCSSDLPFEKF